MKVLMLAPGNSPHARRLIDLLLDAGWAVTCLDGLNPLPQPRAGYEFIPLPGVRGIRYRWMRDHGEAWVRAWQIRRIWRRVRPDVVNCQWIDVRAEACAHARLRPLVLSCWGSDINQLFTPGGATAHLRRRICRTLARADYLTADSPELLQRCAALTQRAVPARLFFYGIDPGMFQPGYASPARALREKLGIPAGATVILSPRRFHPMLGQQHILEAFARVVDGGQVPEPVLVFRHYLTSDAAFEQAVRQETQRRGLANRVFWLGDGAYEEVPVHYALADAVVSYAAQDGFPVSFFEAALCQRPVVTSRLPAYEGVFGDVFFTAPPADPAALAEALTRCLLEPSAARQQRVARAADIALAIGDQRRSITVLTEIFATLAAKGARHVDPSN